MSSSYNSYSVIKGLFVLASTTSAICSGGLFFTSFVHAPAYVKNTSDESLLKQWKTMGATGKTVTPSLALIAAGANFVNSYMTRTHPQQYRFIAAGVLSLSIIPYTFATLATTNAELASREEKMENNSDLGHLDVRQLINRWSDLSAVRGFLMLASAILSFDGMLHLTF